MKTKMITLISSFVLLTNFVFTQVILHENFDGNSIPSDWTVYDNDSDGNGWYAGWWVPGGAMVDNNPNGNDDWLITPPLALVGGFIEFTVQFGTGEYYSTEFADVNVKLSTTGNSISDFTTTLDSIIDVPLGPWENMTTYSYDLSDYSGQNIYLAAQCLSGGTYNLRADNFFVDGYPDPVAFTRIEFYENVTPNSNNPENLINKGRPVRFKLNIQNDLSSNILTGYSSISTENEYVTITDSEATYNNVTSGASAWSVDEFEIIIDNSMPSGTDISFTLTVEQQLDPPGPWSSEFSFPVEPLMVHFTLMDDDGNPDSNGDNDGVIEPGETIEVIPLLENLSTSTLYDVEGRLTSGYNFNDPNLTIDVWNNHSGASGTVYDTYGYNVQNNSQQPVNPGDNQIQPEVDFVFDYSADEAYEFTMNLIVTSYLGGESNTSNWEDGGVKMTFASDFILNEGQEELSSMGEELNPHAYVLYPAYPNPFNPVTTIRYDLPEDAMVNITIYDMMGRVVKTMVSSQQSAGFKSVQWNATNDKGSPVSAGLYLYTIQAGEFRQTKKMVLLK